MTRLDNIGSCSNNTDSAYGRSRTSEFVRKLDNWPDGALWNVGQGRASLMPSLIAEHLRPHAPVQGTLSGHRAHAHWEARNQDCHADEGALSQ